MFDLDRWREIFEAISKNKLRTLLTGFTISFAILLFTLLFGIGNGLQNTFKKDFARNADNAIYIFTGKTSKAYKGFQIGRDIQLKNNDYQFLRKEFGDKIQYISAIKENFFKVIYQSESSSYRTRGVHPDNQFIDDNKLVAGRYIEKKDYLHNAKVAVIGELIQKDLFGKHSAINKMINIDGNNYKVVGIFTDEGGDNDERVIYIPITTMQGIYGNNDYIDMIQMTFNPNLNNTEAVAFGKDVQQKLREKNNIDPRDESGIRAFNMAEANANVGVVMFGINLVVFIIAFGTLLAGMIGISNIMVYVVKERTKELGIRKALGASPASIVGMILQETLFITILAGYSGLVVGFAVLKWMSPKLEEYFITNASVSKGMVIGGTLLLIISGLFAGYFPAKKAAKIKPIEALNAK